MVEWLPALKKDLSIQTEVLFTSCLHTLFHLNEMGSLIMMFFLEMLFLPCNCFSAFKSKFSHYSFNVSDFLICLKKKKKPFQYICSSIALIKIVILYSLWLFDNCLCTPLVTSSRRVETELILPTYFIPSI